MLAPLLDLGTPVPVRVQRIERELASGGILARHARFEERSLWQVVWISYQENVFFFPFSELKSPLGMRLILVL